MSKHRATTRTRRVVAGLAVAATGFLSVLVGTTHADAAPATPQPAAGWHVDTWKVLPSYRVDVTFTNGAEAVLRPCAYEDSVTCWWDARGYGNGKGHSFVNVIAPSGRVHVAYLNPRFAAGHDRGYRADAFDGDHDHHGE